MKLPLRSVMLVLLAVIVTPLHAEHRSGESGRHDREAPQRLVRPDSDDERGRGRGRERQSDDHREKNKEPSKSISMSEAVKMVQRRFGADVVRAEARSEGGRTVYHLLLHDEGRVWTVRVDAQTGAIH